MIKLYVNDVKPENERHFDITVFPDNTHQVWHVKVLEDASKITRFVVDWKFENQGEFLDVMQLGQLLRNMFSQDVNLHAEWLPFSRQDKPVSNDSTFALQTFLSLVAKVGFFTKITTVDAHSKRLPEGFGVTIIDPSPRINEVLKLTEATLVCFPDKGAALRGYKIDEEVYGAPIVLDKHRDQNTGEILGLKFALKLLGTGMLRSHSVLIVDDLGDGMRTFTEATKLLKSAGAEKVYVYTTHGLYTKGTKICFDAGIDRLFNYKGEVTDVY